MNNTDFCKLIRFLSIIGLVTIFSCSDLIKTPEHLKKTSIGSNYCKEFSFSTKTPTPKQYQNAIACILDSTKDYKQLATYVYNYKQPKDKQNLFYQWVNTQTANKKSFSNLTAKLGNLPSSIKKFSQEYKENDLKISPEFFAEIGYNTSKAYLLHNNEEALKQAQKTLVKHRPIIDSLVNKVEHTLSLTLLANTIKENTDEDLKKLLTNSFVILKKISDQKLSSIIIKELRCLANSPILNINLKTFDFNIFKKYQLTDLKEVGLSSLVLWNHLCKNDDRSTLTTKDLKKLSNILDDETLTFFIESISSLKNGPELGNNLLTLFSLLKKDEISDLESLIIDLINQQGFVSFAYDFINNFIEDKTSNFINSLEENFKNKSLIKNFWNFSSKTIRESSITDIEQIFHFLDFFKNINFPWKDASAFYSKLPIKEKKQLLKIISNNDLENIFIDIKNIFNLNKEKITLTTLIPSKPFLIADYINDNPKSNIKTFNQCAFNSNKSIYEKLSCFKSLKVDSCLHPSTFNNKQKLTWNQHFDSLYSETEIDLNTLLETAYQSCYIFKRIPLSLRAITSYSQKFTKSISTNNIVYFTNWLNNLNWNLKSRINIFDKRKFDSNFSYKSFTNWLNNGGNVSFTNLILDNSNRPLWESLIQSQETKVSTKYIFADKTINNKQTTSLLNWFEQMIWEIQDTGYSTKLAAANLVKLKSKFAMNLMFKGFELMYSKKTKSEALKSSNYSSWKSSYNLNNLLKQFNSNEKIKTTNFNLVSFIQKILPVNFTKLQKTEFVIALHRIGILQSLNLFIQQQESFKKLVLNDQPTRNTVFVAEYNQKLFKNLQETLTDKTIKEFSKINRDYNGILATSLLQFWLQPLSQLLDKLNSQKMANSIESSKVTGIFIAGLIQVGLEIFGKIQQHQDYNKIINNLDQLLENKIQPEFVENLFNFMARQ